MLMRTCVTSFDQCKCVSLVRFIRRSQLLSNRWDRTRIEMNSFVYFFEQWSEKTKQNELKFVILKVNFIVFPFIHLEMPLLPRRVRRRFSRFAALQSNEISLSSYSRLFWPIFLSFLSMCGDWRQCETRMQEPNSKTAIAWKFFGSMTKTFRLFIYCLFTTD